MASSTKITIRLAGGHTVTIISEQECTETLISEILRPFENALDESHVTMNNFDDVAKYGPRKARHATLINTDYIATMEVEEIHQ